MVGTEQAALRLRHGSKRSSGTWGPGDYDVLQGGQDTAAFPRREPALRALGVNQHATQQTAATIPQARGSYAAF